MPHTIAIDFETYYDAEYGIKEQGSDGYIEDARFDAYLLSVASSEGWTFVGDPKDFDWNVLDGQIVVAHNASFDQKIYNVHFRQGRRGPAEFHCTADLAAFCGYPRNLEGAARHILNKTRDKTIRDKMKGVNRKAAAANPEFQTYALEDAVDCLAIWQTLSGQWPDTERRISLLTRQMGWAGLYVDRPHVERSIAHLDNEYETRRALIPWADSAALGSPVELRRVLEEKGIPVPASTRKDDEAFKAWLEEYRGDVPFVTAISELRSIRKTQANFNTILKRTRCDGTFPYNKFYFGAHTGRWAGAGGFNMENLPRDEKFGVNMRAAFCAAPGKTFIISDYSQIEPRVLAVLSEDHEFIRLCLTMSPYVAHGVLTGRIDDPEAFEKARKVSGSQEARTYSGLKAEVLLLGYGGGAVTFQRNAKVYGIDVELYTAQAMVDVFRRGRPKIPAYWRKIENEFRWYIGSASYQPRLPSGRSLTYWEPRQKQVIVKGEPCIELVADTVKGGKRVKPGDATKKIYGGFLCENFVQAVARDLLAHGLLNVFDTIPQARPLLTVHDEIIIEVDARRAKSLLPIVKAAMVQPPSWMPDIPLDVGVEISDHYKK